MKKFVISPPGVSLMVTFFILLSMVLLNKMADGLAAQSNSVSPTNEQDEALFMPVVVSEADVVTDAQQMTMTDDGVTKPQPDLPVLPEPESKMQSFKYAEATRGQVIRLGGIDVKLPEDAYVEGVIVGITPIIGSDHLNPPIFELRRDGAMVNVEADTGRMEFIAASPEERSQDRQAFEFLIDALGADKIMEVQK
jgi:hypothetical protein